MKRFLTLFTLLTFGLTMTACQDEEPPAPDVVLAEILATIDIPTEIDADLELQDSYTWNGHTATATWHSTSSSVITSEGAITPSEVDRSAVLTLRLSYDGETLDAQFPITVLRNEAFDVLFAVFHSLVKPDIPSDAILSDLNLPNQYTLDGETVDAEWSSSEESALTNDGLVTLGATEVDVTLTLTLTYQGTSRTDTFTVTVGRDPDTLPSSWWHTVDVYTGDIEGETADPSTPPCFPGAVYRKVVSNTDHWMGIEATITLPEFLPDPDRFDDATRNYYLDNASIYMGGHAYYESDVGLAWMIGYASPSSVLFSTQGIAFRPFWRYIDGASNTYQNANVSDFQYYYYPGDTVQMSVFSPEPGMLQMRIELLELTTHPSYAHRRDAYGLGDDFERVFLTEPFPSPGMGAAMAEFKRVNAIDQVANEAKPTINTDSQVLEAIWHEVYLYRYINDTLYKVPLTEERSASMFCPLGTNENGDFSDAFTVSYDGVDPALGGEIVTIDPANGTGRLYNTSAYFTEEQRKRWML